MDDLIRCLLRLSRINSSELQSELVDLSGLAAPILHAFKEFEPNRRVESVIAPGLAVTGDPAFLKIVLQNLLENAWKFTAKRAPARIEFGKVMAGQETVFFVRDNGEGFDAAFAHQLFVPFQRLPADAEFAGIRIGLSTAQRIIQRHGGRIWAQGALDQGATFYFSFPEQRRTSNLV